MKLKDFKENSKIKKPLNDWSLRNYITVLFWVKGVQTYEHFKLPDQQFYPKIALS